MGVRAIEDRHRSEGHVLRAIRGEQVLHDELRLFAIVLRLEEADRRTAFPVGEEVLVLAVVVVRDHRRGAGKDRLGRAVVLFELDDGRVGVVLLEVEDVADVRAPPCVDRLVGIADDAEIAVARRELADQPVLHAVRVLVFVDEHVGVLTAVVLEHPRMRSEEFRGEQQQVSEVERLGVGELALILRVEPRDLLLVEILRLARRGGRKQPGVLPLVDLPPDPARVVDLRIEALRLEHFLDHAQRVRIVVDHESATAREMADVPAQDPHADRVEGADRDVARDRTQELLDALLHLARGLVREGHGQDLVRRNPAHPDQIGDPRRQHARLAGARAGEHQQGPLGRLDGLALGGVQTREDALREIARRFGRGRSRRLRRLCFEEFVEVGVEVGVHGGSRGSARLGGKARSRRRDGRKVLDGEQRREGPIRPRVVRPGESGRNSGAFRRIRRFDRALFAAQRSGECCMRSVGRKSASTRPAIRTGKASLERAHAAERRLEQRIRRGLQMREHLVSQIRLRADEDRIDPRLDDADRGTPSTTNDPPSRASRCRR